MNTELEDLIQDLTLWNHYRKDDPYMHDGKIDVQGLTRECFDIHTKKGRVTLAVYYYNLVPVLKAWGYDHEKHCSFHSVFLPSSQWSKSINSCPQFSVLNLVNGSALGFSINHDNTLYVYGNHASSDLFSGLNL
jgi:hypothetical protein